MQLQKRIINIDQTILNTLQVCAKMAHFSFHENLKSNYISASIEKGQLMHVMLEIYYGNKSGCVNLDSATWKALFDAGFVYNAELPWQELVNFCCEVGRFYASKFQTSPSELEETIEQFKAYAEFYRYEPWQALAVEDVGSRVLFEDETWQIIYTCKTDIVAQNGHQVIPWDHKTGNRRTTPENTSNQFRGTCFVLGTNHIMINKIGFQKTLSPAERFQRFTLSISDEIINEWQTDTIYWAKLYWNYIENNFWPRTLTSCDKFSGCMYRPICSKDPRHRLYVIEQNFHVGEAWDVAKVLEED